MSLNAYKTMAETWNTENAVKNFMELNKSVMINKLTKVSGEYPCSFLN